MRAAIHCCHKKMVPVTKAVLAIAPALNALALGLVLAIGWPLSVHGKTPEVSITADRALHFGTFMVFGSGSRTVSAAGAVIDNSIVALEGMASAPARFTVSYDRGNESKHVLDIELELVISSMPRIREGGVEGAVANLQTDLPGAAQVRPGEAIRLTLAQCRTRVCSRSFHVGGRLDVTRSFGGGVLLIPIPIDAAVISVERQR